MNGLDRTYLIFFFLLTTWIVGAQEALLPPDLQVEISPAVGVNSPHLEFAPVFYGNGIVFVQAREKGGQAKAEDFIDRGIGEPFFELMYSELDPNGLPRRSQSFSPNIRTRFHEGPACFSNQEQKVYFTRSNYREGQQVTGADGAVYMKIYEAEKGPDDWEHISELPFCSDNFSVCHPSVSPDGKVIIFSSDMPGGYGGMDLYKSERMEGVWGEPVNLGPQVNTKKNEILPNLHSSGFLLFSSDGHKGMGGLDFFIADISDPLNAFVQPLPEPFNSSRDDLGITLSADATKGFFSSNRKGGQGKDDIYFFRAQQAILPTSHALFTVNFKFVDNREMVPVEDVSVWLFPLGPSGPEGIDRYFETEILQTEDQEDGSMILKLQRKRIPGQAAPWLTDAMGKIRAELAPFRDYLLIAQANGYRSKEENYTSEILSDSSVIVLGLSRPMPKEEKEACVTVSGIILSKADNTPVPVSTVSIENLCDGEVTVLQSDALGKYSFCLPEDCNFIARIEKKGYLPSLSRINPADNREYKHFLIEEYEIPLTEGDIIVLENIYYDFNKSAIQKGAAEELDALVELMKKYPEMEIELSSHTDARGTKSYNLELAERRGYAARDYLTARGIDAGRIVVVPKGEEKVRNRCTDGVECTESEHQYNRRTEIRVLKTRGDDTPTQEEGG